MAVDWSSYRLAPDFSGLAAGIQGYFKNRQAAEIAAANQATAQQKMGMEQAYKDRMLALEEQKAMRGGNAFRPNILKGQMWKGKNGRLYESAIVGDANNPLASYTVYIDQSTGQPVPPDIVESLELSITSPEIEFAGGRATAAGQVAEAEARGAGAGKAATGAKIKEAEETGKQRVIIKSDYRNLGKVATKQLNTVSELERALSAIETGKVESAFASLKKNLGFDASGYENADAAVYAVASDLLKQEPGPKTDFDFNAKVEQLANSKRQKEANRLIIERLRRSAQYDTANVKNFNKWVNNGNDPLEYTDLDYEEFLAEKEPKGKDAQKPASQSKAVIDYNQYED